MTAICLKFSSKNYYEDLSLNFAKKNFIDGIVGKR